MTPKNDSSLAQEKEDETPVDETEVTDPSVVDPQEEGETSDPSGETQPGDLDAPNNEESKSEDPQEQADSGKDVSAGNDEKADATISFESRTDGASSSDIEDETNHGLTVTLFVLIMLLVITLVVVIICNWKHYPSVKVD